MPDLVSDGAEFSCMFCSSKLKLKVTTSSTEGDSKKIANQTNCFFPPSGGNCTFPPSVPPSPCPGLPPGAAIAPGQTKVAIDNQLALGDGCKFMCPKGQIVSLSSAGQSVAKNSEAEPSRGSQIDSLTPVVGSIKSLVQLVTGTDEVRGEEVSRVEEAIGLILWVSQ